MTHRFSSKKNIFDGVFNYINQISKINDDYDLIHLTSPSNITIKNNALLSDFFPPTGKTYIVVEGKNESLTFILSTIYVNITGYSIKSTQNTDRVLKDWTFEAKNNESNEWELLHSVTEYNNFLYNDAKYFNVKNGVYNSFRVTKLNINDDNTTYFDLHGFEIFGQICNPVNCDIVSYCTFYHENSFIYRMAIRFCFIALVI